MNLLQLKRTSLVSVWVFILLSTPGFLIPQSVCGVEPLLWPLDLDSHYLTSNFMEHRSGRFHAGIDLKTNTVTGFAVRAVEDGYILRLRATPNAYGRAIYMQGVSGKTYVYAHLARFNDILRQEVNAARKVSGNYRVRLEFKPGQIAVRRGDILGLSGESGTGGPHLHFEVRDKYQRPLNPHAQGFPVNDTLAPVFHTLRVIPVTDKTTINGQKAAMVLQASDLKQSKVGLKGEMPCLNIRGAVAFSAKIIDGADAMGHKLEPYVMTVTVDDTMVFECRNDIYTFSDNSLQRLEWLNIPAGENVPHIREHWLYNKPENTLAGRSGFPGNWAADDGVLSDGLHHVAISALDYTGNETRIQLDVTINNDTESSNQIDSQENTLSKKSPDSWHAQPVRVVVQADPAGNPTHWLTPFGKGQKPDAGPFPAVLHLSPDFGDPVLTPTFLTHIQQDFTPNQMKAAVRQGLTPKGSAVAYLTADWPIDASVLVPTHQPLHGDSGLMAYYWKNGKWHPSELVVPGKDSVPSHFPISKPGVYGFFIDNEPPVLGLPAGPLQVSRNDRHSVHGISMPYWQFFPLALIDLGSGVAPETIKTFLDGEPFIVEPDLPRGQILVVLPDDTTVGQHLFKIEVADEVGNHEVWEFPVIVSPQRVEKDQ